MSPGRHGTRDVALEVLRDVFGPQHRGAQEAFDYRVRAAGLSPRDRAFTAELAYGTIKMRRALDWYVAPYIAERTRPLPLPIAEALRMGAYQLRFMDRVDTHAAVFETVGAALRVGHRGTAGLVNAVLRRLTVDALGPPARADFPQEDDYLGTRYSLPTWMVTQFRTRLGAHTEEALAGVDAPPQVAVRVNALKASTDDVVAELANAGISVHASALVAESLVVEARAETQPRDDPQGRWALQSEAACIPVDLLAPQPGETVLELCSGRGNKAVQLAARLCGAGQLTCVEDDERRSAVLQRRLSEAGGDNAAVITGDAREVRTGEHDAVLLDAPCSAVGIIGRHAEARWRKRPEDGARFAALQKELLAAAGSQTRAGGRLTYSVCSIDPRECEDVVEGFLSDGAFARSPLPQRYAPFATRSGDVLVPPGIAGRDGFYVASLHRRTA